MPGLRLDHIVVVVDDLDAAVAFFTELGMTVEGEAPIEGDWVDRVNGIAGVRVDIVMLNAPANDPPNTLGYRSVMFEVDDIDAAVARLQAHGGELMGEIVRYEDVYRLCYLRGPAGIIVALAESLG
jgi:catechol 2,3-dioxygenase-like lactoylglutathione lyase family enzyme